MSQPCLHTRIWTHLLTNENARSTWSHVLKYFLCVYHLDDILLFYPRLFPIWTQNFALLSFFLSLHCLGTWKEINHFISLGLPSPLQLLHICALTPVSGHIDAKCVLADLQTALRWPNTCGLTRERSLTSARYVNWSSHSRGIWIGTCAYTNTAACENAGS